MGLFNFFRSIDKQTSEKETIDEKQIIPQLQNVLFDDSKTLYHSSSDRRASRSKGQCDTLVRLVRNK